MLKFRSPAPTKAKPFFLVGSYRNYHKGFNYDNPYLSNWNKTDKRVFTIKNKLSVDNNSPLIIV